MTMTLISTVTVGAGTAASIDFNSIPQSATDLFIVVSARGAFNNVVDRFEVTVNSNSGTWSHRRLEGRVSTKSVTTGSGNVQFSTTDYMPALTASANVFGDMQLYFPNYSGSATKTASFEVSTTKDSSSFSTVSIGSARYSSSSAISQVSIKFGQGNVAQYSTASLYTITKGSGGATVS